MTPYESFQYGNQKYMKVPDNSIDPNNILNLILKQYKPNKNISTIERPIYNTNSFPTPNSNTNSNSNQKSNSIVKSDFNVNQNIG